MIDGSEKRKRQLACELQNSLVFGMRSEQRNSSQATQNNSRCVFKNCKKIVNCFFTHEALKSSYELV